MPLSAKKVGEKEFTKAVICNKSLSEFNLMCRESVFLNNQIRYYEQVLISFTLATFPTACKRAITIS